MSNNEYKYAEGPALKTLEALGYEVIENGDNLDLNERDDLRKVVLEDRLKENIKELNPWISSDNLQRAVDKLKKVKATDPMQINKEIHKRLIQHVSVTQDRGEGKKNYTVKYIDFNNPENNDFLAVSQFKVVTPKENIAPDITLFVNGLPLAVIECKSPTITDPAYKAIDQLLRYQNIRKDDGTEGAEKLFHYNQLTVASWGDGAVSSTYGAPAGAYKPWKDTYPATENQIKKELNKEKLKGQDKLLYALFKKERFLEIIRFFTVFEEKGQGTVKMVCRYQQYRAVKKAIEEIEQREKLKKDGGVIWHTQGSGKSLTMLFLGLKLRQRKDNPTLLIVTDRTTLDDQIKDTFEQCGFPNPKQAKSIDDLKEKLKGASGQTITTLIQKFQDEKENFEVLNRSRDIYVMVDEAHRTQYKSLANNMRTALPNAFYIGFSGTPIEKERRSTSRTFGRYIDKYTIDQSIEDGATLEIFYQNRKSEIKLEEGVLDNAFDRVMKERSEEEKEEVKKRYVRQQDLAGAGKRIDKIVLDIIDHFEKKIADPFKGMVVTINRKTAIEYKKRLDKYNGPESAVIISSEHNDSEDIKRHIPSSEEEKKLKDRFKDPNDDLKLVIVCEKLLTGFDAPVAQVMYLDKHLKGHNLLQAIARVNRPYEDKNYGLIIDYYGVSENLQSALDEFSSKDVQRAMTELTDDERVISRLQSAHRKAKSFFKSEDLDDLEACVELLEDERTRLEFNNAYKSFSKMMDIVLPEPEANPYKKDLKRLGEIYQMAKNRYRDESMNLAGCGKKVRELIREHVYTSGIEVINPEPVSITKRGEFEDQLGRLKDDKARMSEMKHAVMHEITVSLDDDPVYYKSLEEKVKSLIDRYNQKRLAEEEVIKELQDVIEDIRSRDKKAQEKGFSNEAGLSFYHTLKEEIDLDEEDLKEVTKQLIESIKDKKKIVDWKIKPHAQKEIRKELKLKLLDLFKDREIDLTQEKIDSIVSRFIKLARRHY